MIYKVDQLSIDKYYKSTRKNNSLLSDLFYNPKKAQKKLNNSEIDDNDKPHLIKGAALDCIMTQPEEEFNNQFLVVDAKRPTGMTGVFIENLPLDISPESGTEEYREAYEVAGYRWPIKSAIDVLWNNKAYKSWLLGRKNAGERKLISKEEFEAVQYSSKSIMYNPFTRKLFDGKDPNIDVYYQVPIYFEIKVRNEATELDEYIECKALLDMIVVDNRLKTIKVVDLKSTGFSLTKFNSSAVNFGYYRQGSFYHQALTQFFDHTQWKEDKVTGKSVPTKHFIISETHELNELLGNCAGYKLLNTQFLVAESKPFFQHGARFFKMTDADMLAGVFGGIDKATNTWHPGYYTLLQDLIWHIDTDYWEMPKEVYQNQGVQILDLFHEQERVVHPSYPEITLY